MAEPVRLSILGGGPAGLAVGFYARERGLSFQILEAADRVGGNCITVAHGEFLFDSGAHRFHDKDAVSTADVKRLLGEELQEVDSPSRIFHRGRWVDFPLAPLNLLVALGPAAFLRALASLARARMRAGRPDADFESVAVHTYGRYLAERLLLNYSEKLWGVPCRRLSPRLAGSRLGGLSFRSLLVEAVLGAKARTKHLEGSRFYYPTRGYGRISERLAEVCGTERIRLGARITRVLHDGRRIEALEVNGAEHHGVDQVVSTLPLNLLLRLMDPAPPAATLAVADSLRFRSLVVVALFLAVPSVTESATVYFPDPELPMTRVSEPRNRSPQMSPAGRTSLITEVPCQFQDATWRATDAQIVTRICEALAIVGWARYEQVLDARVLRIPFAYPILELGFEERVASLQEYLASFENLRISGRNGQFQYAWMHDALRFGREIVAEYTSS
ncbi:MAG: FAD-dependent oxidoreductase [Gemmatimonadetes bacterium]|nr:FAD-dependent oxidoreductase [Gemmatimonadota bacterium]